MNITNIPTKQMQKTHVVLAVPLMINSTQNTGNEHTFCPKAKRAGKKKKHKLECGKNSPYATFPGLSHCPTEINVHVK